MITSGTLVISEEVTHALANKKPIVALETCLVTHGPRFPTNLQRAEDLEAIVRSTGAIPATIGMVGGSCTIPCVQQYLIQRI